MKFSKSLFFLNLIFNVSFLLTAQEYKEPTPEVLNISHTKLSLDAVEKEKLATCLGNYTRFFNGYNAAVLDYCHKCLSIAVMLDETNKAALVSNNMLKNKSVTGVSEDPQLVENVLAAKTKLLKGNSMEDIKLAGLILYLANLAYPQDENLIYEVALYEKKHGKVNWDAILKPNQNGNQNGEIVRGAHPDYQNKAKEPTKDLSGVNGLVVRTFPDGTMVGNKLEIIITKGPNPNPNKSEWTIRNGDAIGEQMEISFAEAIKVLATRYPYITTGSKYTISFGDKYSPKDGGSAGTAFSILLFSMFEEFKIDEKVAVTGDITVDWKTRKVGGVVEKILGAINEKCNIVIVPQENFENVNDLVLLHTYKPLLQAQIFSVTTLEEAIAIARTDRKKELKEAIDRYSTLQNELNTKGFKVENKVNYLKELDAIMALAPTHASAKILSKIINGTLTKALSLDKSAEEMLSKVSNLKNYMPQVNTKLQTYNVKELRAMQANLKKVAPLLDKKSTPVYNSLNEIIESVVVYQEANKSVWDKPNTQSVSWKKKLENLGTLHAEIIKKVTQFEKDLMELAKKL